ncbi:MAG TPA: nitroreductase family protein [Bacteroidales bacterium]
MKSIELYKIRQSVRKYSEAKVSREVLHHCLEAARLAPSASNSQPWKFILVDQEPILSQVARATFSEIVPFNKFTMQAPVIVVVIIDKPKLITRVAMKVKKRDWQLVDIGIVASHFCQQAAEDGLGTCMIGWFDEKKVKEILKIPAGKTIGLLITAGYAPDGYPLRTKIRKPLEEIISYNAY